MAPRMLSELKYVTQVTQLRVTVDTVLRITGLYMELDRFLFEKDHVHCMSLISVSHQ
jgi:hypothetical protein